MEEDIRPFPPLVAGLLFAALVVLVVAIFTMDIVGFAETGASIDETNGRIADLDTRLAQIANAKPDPDARNANMWISAQTSGVAAAAIQKVAGDIFAKARASVREVQILAADDTAEPPPPGEPVPVSTSFLFETTHAGLRQILLGIDAVRPLLQTDKITIEALPRDTGVGEMTLRVEVQITGYWLQVKA